MNTVAKIIVSVISVIIIVLGILGFMWYPLGDTQDNYLKKVYDNGHFENTFETAIPQTEMYNIIKDHFTSKLPKGKTEKKLIVIGYDGCRLDVLDCINDKKNGGFNLLLDDGGKLYFSYCGGVPYPQLNTQDTSTAPGWCSMLTGVLADEHGITENDIEKSNDHLTVLTTLVEDKTIDSSAFYVSWKGHFSRENATYNKEVQYIKDNNINTNFQCNKGDKGTVEAVLTDLAKPDCSDFIFSIIEYCDHSGHQTGFYSGHSTYKKAFNNADSDAESIIKAVKARPTYDTEDWLIILTTDHGGINRNHGGASIQERYTFILTSKDVKPVETEKKAK